jgi:hypothetical protein
VSTSAEAPIASQGPLVEEPVEAVAEQAVNSSDPLVGANEPEAPIEGAVEIAAPADAVTAPPEIPTRPPSRIRRLAGMLAFAPLNALLAVLKVFDWPFSGLSLRLKNLLGAIGIATAIVAAATWIAQDYLKHGLHR